MLYIFVQLHNHFVNVNNVYCLFDCICIYEFDFIFLKLISGYLVLEFW